MRSIIVITLGFLIFHSSLTEAQELNCTVQINTESIPSAQRDYLRNFADDISRYLNNTRFTNEDLDGEKIPCSLDISFKSTSSDNRYLAQVFIGSQRPMYNGNEKSNRATVVIRIFDEKWEFNYMPNQRMIHDDLVFDPLTDFLDFYAYLIIGYDLETYVPLSGSQCFQKAFNTVQQASSSSGGTDWKQSSASYSRFGIADELNNAKYSPFLTAFNNYHFDGLDMITTDQQKALETILTNIESINDLRRRQNPTSVVVKQFFDAKNKEIAELFLGYSNRQVYERLAACDPEHRSTYQDWKEKR